jgi:hypothetical protein
LVWGFFRSLHTTACATAELAFDQWLEGSVAISARARREGAGGTTLPVGRQKDPLLEMQ